MIEELLRSARAAVAAAPPIGSVQYEDYCHRISQRLEENWSLIREANREDLDTAGRRGLPSALLDRLRIDDAHLGRLQLLTRTVLAELASVTAAGPAVPMPSGGVRQSLPKPLGVALMVYEARPTVTVEGALLPVVVGNAVLLRGGKEVAGTNTALARVARAALVDTGLPADLVTVLDDPNREQLRALLKRPDAVDVLIPRGSPSLVDYCRTASSIPVIASGGGVNHIYVHGSADLDLAAEIILDSKVPDPTACNTVETVLVDAPAAAGLVAAVERACRRGDRQLTIRLDPRVQGPRSTGPCSVEPLREHDAGREFMDAVIGIRVVDGQLQALEHIRQYGSSHTEGVVAADPAVAEEFGQRVDAAAIVVNGSLRLHDGPTLGLGSEISISTGRLHVRGPVTLRSLVTSSLIVKADGALRGTAAMRQP